MGSYDKINKVKEEYKKIIEQKDKEILSLKNENLKLKNDNDSLRQKLYDAGQGQGEVNHLKSIIVDLERDNKTLQNKISKSEGKEIISSFDLERKKLIQNIRKLSFPKWPEIEALAIKFRNGLENAIMVAYKIQINAISDRDYYTYLFRDDIISLLEKILHVLTASQSASSSGYLLKLIDGHVKLDKKYYEAVPLMKNKDTLQHILWLVNLESKGYHGSQEKEKRVFINEDTNERRKYINFLNLDKDEQLSAIFTVLEFIYFVFTNKDKETNLQAVSSCWFKTL